MMSIVVGGAVDRSSASSVAVAVDVMILSSTEITKGDAWGDTPSAMGYMARVGSSTQSLGGSPWSVEHG